MHHRLAPVLLLSLLAGCGGGEEALTVPPAGQQQYPGGFWEGTAGSGAAQRRVFGYIDPGASGTGGEFYLAREAAGTVAYDALYGRVTLAGDSLLATRATYFSVQDGKFMHDITWRGTASISPGGSRTDTISSYYSDPVGTLAATGAPVPLKLTLSPLNDRPARLPLLAGNYRGGGVFGGSWVLTVAADGAIRGSVGACSVTGTAWVRAADSAAYGVSLDLAGDAAQCGGAGTNQTGVAALRFDADSRQTTGVWLLTRNTTGPLNTLVLEGNVSAVPAPEPEPEPEAPDADAGAQP